MVLLIRRGVSGDEDSWIDEDERRRREREADKNSQGNTIFRRVGEIWIIPITYFIFAIVHI